MNNVEDISQYLYSTSVDDLNIEIRDMKEFMMLLNDEVLELQDICKFQAGEIYTLKQNMKNKNSRLL